MLKWPSWMKANLALVGPSSETENLLSKSSYGNGDEPSPVLLLKLPMAHFATYSSTLLVPDCTSHFSVSFLQTLLQDLTDALSSCHASPGVGGPTKRTNPSLSLGLRLLFKV